MLPSRLLITFSISLFSLSTAFARGDCRLQLENYGGPGTKMLVQACSERAIKKALRDRRFSYLEGKLVVVGKNFLLMKSVKDLTEAIKFYNQPEAFLDHKLKQKMKLEAVSDVKVIAGKTAVPWSEDSSVVIHKFQNKDFAFVMDAKSNLLYSVDLTKFGNIVPTTKTEISKLVKAGRVSVLSEETLVIVGGKSPKHQVVKIIAQDNLPALKPIEPQEWKLSFQQAGPLTCYDSTCFALSFTNNELIRIDVDPEGKVKPGQEISLPELRDPHFLTLKAGNLTVYEGDGKLTRISIK